MKPSSRKKIDMAAVTKMATIGASVRERLARILGSRPSSANCESVRDAPANGWTVP